MPGGLVPKRVTLTYGATPHARQPAWRPRGPTPVRLPSFTQISASKFTRYGGYLAWYGTQNNIIYGMKRGQAPVYALVFARYIKLMRIFVSVTMRIVYIPGACAPWRRLSVLVSPGVGVCGYPYPVRYVPGVATCVAAKIYRPIFYIIPLSYHSACTQS